MSRYWEGGPIPIHTGKEVPFPYILGRRSHSHTIPFSNQLRGVASLLQQLRE